MAYIHSLNVKMGTGFEWTLDPSGRGGGGGGGGGF